MEEYLITARSVTHAQRMAQVLERRGLRVAVARAPIGLTGKGCGYVLRLRGRPRTEAALRRASCPHRFFAVVTTAMKRWKYDLF